MRPQVSHQVDEWWQWLYEPLRELEKEAAWPECRAAFLARLGLVEPVRHPVVEELLRQLDELPADKRAGELAADPLAGRAYAIIEQLALAGFVEVREPVFPPGTCSTTSPRCRSSTASS